MRDDLTLEDIGRLVREAQSLAEEEKAIDLAAAIDHRLNLPLSNHNTTSVPVPSDIRALLVKLRKDAIQARIKEIEDLVLPQKR